jgi:hypothetical protein
VSGSYTPGDIFLFKGLGKGAFAQRTKLALASGNPVCVGVASSACIVDWDRDGKLDLVVGNAAGEVLFVRNESTGAQLAFGASELVFAPDDEREGHDAGPLVADWDGDGIADLIVGAVDGSVTFVKCTGAKGALRLAHGVPLLAPLTKEERAVTRVAIDPKTGRLQTPALVRSLNYAKPSVFDWNGDGKLDLLVGDSVSFSGPEPELSADEIRARDELELSQSRIDDAIADLEREALKRARLELHVTDESEGMEVGGKVAWRRDEILRANPKYASLQEQSVDTSRALRKSTQKLEAHGFVWVYLRK